MVGNILLAVLPAAITFLFVVLWRWRPGFVFLTLAFIGWVASLPAAMRAFEWLTRDWISWEAAPPIGVLTLTAFGAVLPFLLAAMWRFLLTWLGWTACVYVLAASLVFAGTATGNWGPHAWTYALEMTASIFVGSWAPWTAFFMALAGLVAAVVQYEGHR